MSDTPDVDLSLIPQYRRTDLPMPRPASLISHADGVFTAAHHIDGIDTFGSLHDACSSTEYYVFDSSVYKLGRKIGDVLFFNGEAGNPQKKGVFYYAPRTVERMLSRVAQDYLDAKDRYKAWLESPNDYATAWEFAAEHPAFWVVKGVFNSPSPPRVNVIRDDQGPVIIVENGPVLSSEATTDPFATGEGSTFEKAVLDHARCVDRRYFWDGTLRPEDPYTEGFDE